MGKSIKIHKDRKGVALIWVIGVFTIVMIFMNSIVYITNQDIRETRMQEERLQTYYIALAGIDLTYAALMDTSNEPLVIDNIISTLKVDETPIEDDIIVEIGGDEKGTAEIIIDRIELEGTYWIRITSIGKLQDKNLKVTSKMKINEENKNQIIREKFNY